MSEATSLHPAPAGPDDHGRRVSGMFGRIARWYDLLNHVLSLGLDIYWRHQLVRLVRKAPGQHDWLVLDLAAGTMDVSLEILRQHPKASVLAMDFAYPMLLRGVHKAKRTKSSSESSVAAALADGRTLPLPAASVDCITIAFGIRNILPRSKAFAEAMRVLRPGGRMCILEFGTGKSRIWKGVYNFYLRRILPLVGRIVSGDSAAYTYLADTILAFPPAPELAKELLEAGFDKVYYRPMLSGIVYLHVSEKQGPESGKGK